VGRHRSGCPTLKEGRDVISSNHPIDMQCGKAEEAYRMAV